MSGGEGRLISGRADKRQLCYKENITIKIDNYLYLITVPLKKMAELSKSAQNLNFVILKHPCFPAASV